MFKTSELVLYSHNQQSVVSYVSLHAEAPEEAMVSKARKRAKGVRVAPSLSMSTPACRETLDSSTTAGVHETVQPLHLLPHLFVPSILSQGRGSGIMAMSRCRTRVWPYALMN